MTDSATYKRYAEECRRLAMEGPEEHRRILLEHAATWTELAGAAGGSVAPKKEP